jgi:hypothetical protein
MSEINAVRSEMQAKFESDLKSFKDKMIAKLKHDISETVKHSVATALEGINAEINDSLQANNVVVYRNMQTERAAITETMVTAVSTKVDVAVSQAVTRALSQFSSQTSRSLTRSTSPFRKKRQNKENSDNVDMSDGGIGR